MNWIMCFFFCLISFSATPIANESSIKNHFIVWNVGQGQWTTWVRQTVCWHFDMGGEFFNWNKIQSLCGDKENRVSLSHWDLDHIGALKKASRYLPNLCVDAKPIGKAKPAKEALIPKRKCALDESIWRWYPHVSKNIKSNELSQVFLAAGFLLPGDSTQKEELVWSKSLPANSARILVLGHHGSRTSTSEYLLDHLSSLKQAVSSARWRRYRHPHPQVLALLKQQRIPVLRTEDWGSLWFEQ